MSRAILKLRSLRGIQLLLENLSNVSNSGANQHTFSNKPVGSGAGRSIILAVTIQDGEVSNSRITAVKVDGISAVEQVSLHRSIDNQVVDTAIYSLELTSQSGDVPILLDGSNSPNSWGLAYWVVKGMKSITATDTASKAASSSSLITTTELEGLAGGIQVGVAAHSSKGNAHTWGSLMTEKDDLSSGSGSGHRHSSAFDLLPGGRVATVETVLSDGSDRFALSTATFR